MMVYSVFHLILSLLIVFLVDIVRKYIHECGHEKQYKKYKILSRIGIDWNKFGMFACRIEEDQYEKFDKLKLKAKKNIFLIGPLIDLIASIFFALMFLILPSMTYFGLFLALILSFFSFLINASPLSGSDYKNYLNFKNGMKLYNNP